MTMTTTFGFIEFVPWFVSLEPEAISKDVSGNQDYPSFITFRAYATSHFGGDFS